MGTQAIEAKGLRRHADGRDRVVARAALPAPRLRHRDARGGARAAVPRARRSRRRRRARWTATWPRSGCPRSSATRARARASPRRAACRVREQYLRLEREAWDARDRIAVEIVGLEPCLPLFGLSACSLGRMAAPVQRGEEVELEVDSLAYGRERRWRAARRLRRVRAPRAAGRHRPRAGDEGAAPARRGRGDRGARRRARSGSRRRAQHFPACGGCRFQDLAYDAQLAAKQAWVEDSLRRIAGHRRAAARADRRRPSRRSTTATRWSTRSRRGPTAAGARPAPRRPLGRGARDRALLAHDRPRQRDPQHDARLGARGAARGLRPGRRHRLPPPPRRSARA